MNNFNIYKTFKGVSNTLKNFTFMGATVSEIAEGGRSTPSPPPPPLVKGVGTKRLGKGRVKNTFKSGLSKACVFGNKLELIYMIVCFT